MAVCYCFFLLSAVICWLIIFRCKKVFYKRSKGRVFWIRGKDTRPFTIKNRRINILWYGNVLFELQICFVVFKEIVVFEQNFVWIYIWHIFLQNRFVYAWKIGWISSGNIEVIIFRNFLYLFGQHKETPPLIQTLIFLTHIHIGLRFVLADKYFVGCVKIGTKHESNRL